MSTKERIVIRAKRALRHMTPTHMVFSRITKQTIMKFADKTGLVYFGYVDQRRDEHRLVRGHTVSATHVDNHYCIGSLRGYDITLVARNDVVKMRGTDKQQRCHWLIVTVDLHTKEDVPHVYIGHHSRTAAFLASYEQLESLSGGIHDSKPTEFTSSYTIFGHHDRLMDINRIITSEVSQVITSHFKQASIEIEDNTIYLYIESQHPSEALLEKMLSNGLWLAQSIDVLLTAVEKD